MKKYLSLVIIICFSVLLWGQELKITFPQNVDSKPGQILIVPIVCENLSLQAFYIYADYFHLFHNFDDSYTVNKLAPTMINPGSKVLIFLSLSPNPQINAGHRYFPFIIKDDQGNSLNHGILGINHVVIDDWEIIPLAYGRFILPELDYTLNYLLVNKGTFPIEFKSQQPPITKIIAPGIPDTLKLKIAHLPNLQKQDFWISYNYEYTITKILPTELVTQTHTIYNVLPIAQKTNYPYQRDFYNLPVNFSAYMSYDESDFYAKRILRSQRFSLFGYGYLDDYPSPYLNWYVRYKHDDFSRQNEVTQYYFSWKSDLLKFSFGEDSYDLDLRHDYKWGRGYKLAFTPSILYFEHSLVQEQYYDHSVHHVLAVGLAWDKENRFYEPQQFLKLKYYQKDTSQHEQKWFLLGGHHSVEHQKIIIESLLKIGPHMKLHFEVFTAQDSLNSKYKKPGLTSELTYHSPIFYHRFSFRQDELNLLNSQRKKNYLSDDFSYKGKLFNLYLRAHYQEEANLYTYAIPYETNITNLFGNLYLNLTDHYQIRGKYYFSEAKFLQPTKNRLYTQEALTGLMYKRSIWEAEFLFGCREEEISRIREEKNIAEFNFALFHPSIQSLNINFFNRMSFDAHEKDIVSQFNIYQRYNHLVAQNFGVSHLYYEQEDWKNYLAIFTNVSFYLPWNHEFRINYEYNLNPTIAQNYRYSIAAEYTIPFEPKIIPKVGNKYKNIRLLDPWQHKPVRGAVFVLQDDYYITNNAGLIRVESEKLQAKKIEIINLPDDLTVSEDLTKLSKTKGNNIVLEVVNFSTLTINAKKLVYARITPQDVPKTQNFAYYQSHLVNLDQFHIETYNDRLEVIIQKVGDENQIFRNYINSEGVVSFDRLTVGTWEIIINDAFVRDEIVFDSNNNVYIRPNENIEFELLLKEKIQKFTHFQK